MPDARLTELLREIRRRAPGGGERAVAIYGPRDPKFANLGTGVLIDEAREIQRASYPLDSRRDLYELTDPAVERAARAVAILIDKARLVRGASTWALDAPSLGARLQLCEQERLREQLCAGFCSAVLIAPRRIATAAHCIRGLTPEQLAARLADIYVVFGFRMADDRTTPTHFADEAVYRPVRIVARSAPESGDDWAIVELDRDVPSTRLLYVRRDGSRTAQRSQ